MGRRKSAYRSYKKLHIYQRKYMYIQKLDTKFNCPFCNGQKSCDVVMDKKRSIARILCHVCLEDFQTSIHSLSQPIDVYNDWIDACEAAN